MIRTLIGLTLIALTGCASVQPETGFPDVQAIAGERLDSDLNWHRTAPPEIPATAPLPPGESRLSIRDATRFALSNNPRIQAFYEEIGIAEADFAAAGLLPNPVFSGLARFPDRTPHGGNVEFNIIGNLLDILMRPARMAVSAISVDQTVLRVSAEILAFAGDVETAYLRLQGALHKQSLLADLIATAETTLKQAEDLHRDGNLDGLSLARERTIARQANIGGLHAELEVTQARAGLRQLLGITAQSGALNVPGRLADLPPRAVADEHSVQTALAKRLDLAAAKRAVDGLGARHQMTLDWRWLRTLEVGFSAERSPDRQRVFGPTLDIELPLFNRGQNDLARTAAELRRQQYEVAALALEIVTEVGKTRRNTATHFEVARQYRDLLIPLHEDVTRITLQHYEQLLVGAIDVQVARSDTARVASEYIDALTAYWIADADLRRVCGGGLRTLTTDAVVGE